MGAEAIERAPRGLSWKRGAPGLYWASMGNGRTAWIERDGRRWAVRISDGMQERGAESAKATTLRGAQAWAERRSGR